VAYRNFDLSVAGYGMFGQKILNATRMVLFDPNRFPSQNVLDDCMTSGITEAPKYSDYFIENGSFFRLQSITLGYTMPNPKALGLSRLRLFVTGENLFCLTGYKGLDPEVQIPDNVLNDPGIDKFNSYPRPRTVSVGVNVSF
jgi:iron complex outermembrane receptor protein